MAKCKWEDWLLLTIWCSGFILHPSVAKLNQSWESWLYRNRFDPMIRALNDRRTRKPSVANPGRKEFEYAAKRRAQGGRDVVACWSRAWDNLWRMAAFDTPIAAPAKRVRVWRYLREAHFGFLQNSFWITPDPISPILDRLQNTVNASEYLVLEIPSKSAELNQRLVCGAWDFEVINRAYAAYVAFLRQNPAPVPGEAARIGELDQWLHSERSSWTNAVLMDPLLPEGLLPSGYLGKEAWEARQRIFGVLARGLGFSSDEGNVLTDGSAGAGKASESSPRFPR